MASGAIGRLFLNRQSASLLLLGFSSGLPNVTIVSSLSFWLTDAGCTPSEIGLLSLAGIPYAAKFLWAPLVDDRRPWWPRSWGRRRTWILWTQLLLAAALAGTAFCGPWGSIDPATGADARGWSSGALVASLVIAGAIVALLSATQDISFDAYRADTATEETRAAAASLGVTGYRLAAAGAGAGAIMLAARAGWPVTIAATAMLMLACVAATRLAPDPVDDRAPRRSFRDAVIEPLRSLWRRLGARAALVAIFVTVFKLPDTLALPMLPPLLVRHLGYGSDDVAIMRQAVGLGVTIAGALVGAAIVPRIGMLRSLLLFGIVQALSNGGFALLAALRLPADHGTGAAHWMAPGTLALLAAVIVEYFAAGLVAAGFVAYLMWLCDRRWSATHFALLSSLVALGASLAGVAGGALVERLVAELGADRGWPTFFVLCILAGIPAIALVPFVTGVRLGGRQERTDDA